MIALICLLLITKIKNAVIISGYNFYSLVSLQLSKKELSTYFYVIHVLVAILVCIAIFMLIYCYKLHAFIARSTDNVNIKSMHS